MPAVGFPFSTHGWAAKQRFGHTRLLEPRTAAKGQSAHKYIKARGGLHRLDTCLLPVDAFLSARSPIVAHIQTCTSRRPTALIWRDGNLSSIWTVIQMLCFADSGLQLVSPMFVIVSHMLCFLCYNAAFDSFDVIHSGLRLFRTCFAAASH